MLQAIFEVISWATGFAPCSCSPDRSCHGGSWPQPGHDRSLAAEVPLPSTSGQAALAHWSLCKHAWTPRRLYPVSSNCPLSREVNQIRYISVMAVIRYISVISISAWVFCLWQKIDKPSFSIEIACYDCISFPSSQTQYVHIMVACYLV